MHQLGDAFGIAGIVKKLKQNVGFLTVFALPPVIKNHVSAALIGFRFQVGKFGQIDGIVGDDFETVASAAQTGNDMAVFVPVKIDVRRRRILVGREDQRQLAGAVMLRHHQSFR